MTTSTNGNDEKHRTKRVITILCAEDDEEDRILLKEALEENKLISKIHFVSNGEELADYLYRRGKYAELAGIPLPSLILLDLNMPRKDGREVLVEIKADPVLRRIPVVVLTSSKAEDDVVHSYDMGVSGFIAKPPVFESFVEVVKILGKYWLGIVELPPEMVQSEAAMSGSKEFCGSSEAHPAASRGASATADGETLRSHAPSSAKATEGLLAIHPRGKPRGTLAKESGDAR